MNSPPPITDSDGDDVNLDQLNEDFDKTVDQPRDLILPLVRHQKEWLAWAINQEASPIKGGILADGFHMGKTAMIIALVMAQRRKGRGSRVLGGGNTTLVVCPCSGVVQWVNEIIRFTESGTARVLVQYGLDNDQWLRDRLLGYDFVITSYFNVEENFSSNPESILHSVKWERIIFDEAYYIEEDAFLALKSTYKWAIRGKDLHGSVEELYLLVVLLRTVPYLYYICEDCDCRILHPSESASTQSSTEECQHDGCGHTYSRHYYWWKKEQPVKTKKIMNLLKKTILCDCLLRRTGETRIAELAPLPITHAVRWITMSQSEEVRYRSLHSESRDYFVARRLIATDHHVYVRIFADIMCLLQAVDHPCLLVNADTELNSDDHADVDNNNRNTAQLCGVCHDPVEEPAVASCSHVFCKACIIDFSSTMRRVSCPSCVASTPVQVSIDFTEVKTGKGAVESSDIPSRVQRRYFENSSKIKALIEEFTKMREIEKGIVFSQFTSFLDLISISLKKVGIGCVKLEENMPRAARDDANRKFTEEPGCRFFLMSYKTAGVSLDLSVASHVFLMETWWNQAVEWQAQYRILKIGQHKPVRIIRFAAEKTIEERMFQLLEDKQTQIVSGRPLDGSGRASVWELRRGDLDFLFHET